MNKNLSRERDTIGQFQQEFEPHAHDAAEIASRLDVDPKSGLSGDEVERRRLKYGRNALVRKKSVSIIRLLWNQLAGPVVALLAIAAIVAFTYGEWREGLAIAAVLFINTAIGFFTELRAVRSMEALRTLTQTRARVRRMGRLVEISAVDLVPGDILLLEGGDFVPADLRLEAASNLLVNESALTGESAPVEKSVLPVESDAPIAERGCMAFKGTSIARGSANGIVVGTGMQTEIGRISKLVSEAEPERSPLERQLRRLGGQLIWVTLLMTALIAGAGIASGRDVFLMIEAAIALAIAAIPEGLPIVATMALARGMWRMAKRNALVEKLSAVETLGATTIIFTDKTGTLTENKMTLRRFAAFGIDIDFDAEKNQFEIDGAQRNIIENDLIREALSAGMLCNNASIDIESEEASGDPLELALLHAGIAAGLDRKSLVKTHGRIKEYAFDSDVKMMATLHNAADGAVFYIKGAPEAVLNYSSFVFAAEKPKPLDDQGQKWWLNKTDELAAQGLRVLALARKYVASVDEPPYENLELLGLAGFYDPPRHDVKSAIAACLRAGIRVVMITGDHAVTAKNIASSIGLAHGEIDVVEGKSLKPPAHLTNADRQRVLRTKIFARVTPAQKLDLVTIYQSAGEIVAMTGDGVNDAPALKKADIGVAMGLRGTQVARQAAAMVLRDDAFSTIVHAIREGRIIFRNIQRFVAYLLSCNLSEVLVVGLAILAGLPLPLLPLQILFLNLVTDVFPAFALATGAGDNATLSRSPRDPKKPILTRSLWIQIIGNGISITLATLGALFLARVYLGLTGDAAVTVSFLTIALAQLWNVFNMRDPRAHPLKNDIVRNPYIWAAIVFCMTLLTLVTFQPSIAEILHLQAPGPEAMAIILFMSLLPLFFGQIGKEISQRHFARRRASKSAPAAPMDGS